MPSPSSEKLTSAYFRAQIQRSVETLEKITARPIVASGRVIPQADDIAIHDGRRLEATVMFLDICKFSSRPSEGADEQMAVVQILSFFFTEMIRIIDDHDGFVEKNTGDGLMAYFAQNSLPGVTTQQRALSCALTMFSAAQNIINPVLFRSGLEPLEFRICMDHGYITVAKVGVARRFNGIVAVGTTANIASKMLAVAQPNTILLGDTMRLGLPQKWQQQFVELETAHSGWVYRKSNVQYPLWRYSGRWKIPAT